MKFFKGLNSTNLIRVLRLLFAIGLLVLLWRLVEGERALELLGSANPVWLLASLFAISLQTVLSASRWRLTAGQLGLSLTRQEALREYYLAQIVNQALPGGVLGDASRAVRSRAPAGLLVSGQAVVLERIAGQIALFVLMLGGLLLSLSMPFRVAWPDWLLLALGLLTFSLLGLLISLLLIGRNGSGKTALLLRSLGSSSRLVFWPANVLWRQVLLSVGTAVCNVAGFTFAAWAIGFQLSFAVALAVVPMILLAMLLPLTISGWGLREGVAVVLFPLVGATATQGLVASLVFGLVCLAAALPGLLFVRSFVNPKAAARDLKRAA